MAVSATNKVGGQVLRSDAPALLDLTRDDVVIDLRDGVSSRGLLRVAAGGLQTPTHSWARRFGWRTVDLLVASVLIVLTAPLMLLIALAVCLTSAGTPLFLQERVGRGGVTFRCAKFRTMHRDSEQQLAGLLAEDAAALEEWLRDHKLKADPRITRLGRLLRRTNLDELPQLFNVASGSMSMVGPRPVVPTETVRYGDDILDVLSVKPGITGLWQVSGRNDLAYDERVALDLDYVRRKTLVLDCSICLRTIGTMISGRGNGAY